MTADLHLKRVVLIDDEKFDQIAYRRTLDKSGLVDEVIAFRSANDALDWFNEEQLPVDVIFLDINMPCVNGFEFLETFQNLPTRGKVGAIVVMLTTSLDPKDRERAESHPLVRDFINKPLNLDHVRSVAELVKRQRAA